MTEQEFQIAQDDMLTYVHPELAKVLRTLAWSEGHAYGYNEVLIHLDNYVDSFKSVNALLKGAK